LGVPGDSANGDCETAELREISGAITDKQVFAGAAWCPSLCLHKLGGHSVGMSKEPKGQDEADKLGDEAIGAIARRIVDLRKKKGLTQAELGKLAGVTQGRIFELEQRTSNITVRTLARMAQVLDVELVELVSGVHTASGNRLADVLEKWTNALAERTAFEKALMEEIRPIIEDMRVLSIRKLEEETRGPGGDAPGPSGAADRKPPRKTT